MSRLSTPPRNPSARAPQSTAVEPIRPNEREALTRSLMNRALKLYEASRWNEVEELCLKILAIDVRHADCLYLLGMAGYKTQRYEMAERMIRRAIAIKDNQPYFHSNLGNVLKALGRQEDSIACYKRALDVQPSHAEALFNLANAFANKKEYDEAVALYRRAVAFQPDFAEAWYNLGNGLRLKQEPAVWDEAMAAYEKALAIRPNYADAWCSLGSLLHDQWKIDRAVECYLYTLKLDPRHAKAANCLANGRFDQGRLTESIAACDLALSIQPDFGDALMNRCLLRLLVGEFERGWEDYEVRWKVYTPRVEKWPPWNGEPLNGARILLHAEQGLGDSLQFMRYVPMVQAAGGTVMLDIPVRLRRLANQLPGLAAITNVGEPVPVFQAHCPLMSLPRAFKTTLETIPHQVPYLSAPPEAMERAAKFPWPEHGFRVGLSWGGNPSHPKNRARSVALASLEPLFSIPNTHFFSLQMGEAAEQLAPYKDRVTDLIPITDDMADTAAQMMQLDLVISIDTALAHLAGALARPLWIPTVFVPDWRWLLEREDCPWYPTARLFRQPARDQWTPVIERMKAELTRLAADSPR